MKTIIGVLFLIFFQSSIISRSNMELLLSFEEKINNTHNVSKIIIYDYSNIKNNILLKIIESTTLQNSIAEEVSLELSGTENAKLNLAIINTLDLVSGLYQSKYYNTTGIIKNKKREKKYDLNYIWSDQMAPYSSSPQKFYLSNIIINKYDNYMKVFKYKSSWHVYSGQIHISDMGKDIHRFNSFEIWINEDLNTWLEFYKNENQELVVAAEGFLISKYDNLIVSEPVGYYDLYKKAINIYNKTYIHRNNILKNTVLGKGLRI